MTAIDPQTPPIRALVVPVTPLQQNCTIVWCTTTNRAAIIDPGGEVERLLGVLKDKGLTLEKIWVTHGHLDHAGGTAALKQFWIDDIARSGAKYGMTDARSFTPDRWLSDGDRVSLGETEFEVYHCPGHTPGHVVFFHRAGRFAQVGDVLFAGSIGRTDFPRGSYDDLIASITGKLWPLGDDVTFVPGHNQVSTFGRERKTNPWVSDMALAQANT
jgi:hydroxyacylglutathione hydrolase